LQTQPSVLINLLQHMTYSQLYPERCCYSSIWNSCGLITAKWLSVQIPNSCLQSVL